MIRRQEGTTIARRGFSGSALKWIALLSMLIDHFAAVVYLGSVRAGVQIFSRELYYTLRLVGRLAFPIFAFLLAEGILHTRSVKKYLLRLLLFGLLSEIPFDLAFRRAWMDWSYQNVFFTLFLGLLAVWLFERITCGTPDACGAPRVMLGLLCIGTAAAAAKLCRTDYGAWGVLVIVSMALFREKEWVRDVLAGSFLLGSSPLEVTGLTDFLLFHFYNGQRGRQAKYIFYIFYPAHLLLLVLIRRAAYGI